VIAARLLRPSEARARRAELVDLVVDSVQSGEAVNFVCLMTHAKANTWWEGALASHESDERLIFAADSGGKMVGTVQLVLAPQGKSELPGRCRQNVGLKHGPPPGVGAALLVAVENEARRIGALC
jgi:hypothetical protein